ncbi:MAG: DUF882 domain-containing protein [Janthinobacterium lividum]
MSVSPRFSRCFQSLVLGAVSLGLALTVRADEVPRMPSVSAQPAHLGLLDTFRLKMHHLHTGESIDVAYKQGGQYSSMGVGMLNHFLRDHRTEDTADYDPREFDLLHALLAKLHRPGATIDIICGFRTPDSNQFLRTRSADTGVAEHSQHILSKAIDIRIPGVSTRALRDAALSLGMGGVGYYPKSGFVHVDVGPVRQWQFGAAAPRQFASRGSRGHRRRRAV